MGERIIQQFPHCDQRVLHYPGECKYCDKCPEWQELRYFWGIAFTGKTPEDGELPCPSDYARGQGGAHVWPGNAPLPVERESGSGAGIRR